MIIEIVEVGAAVDRDVTGSDVTYTVAGAWVGSILAAGVTISVVPVGALTKMLVRPGSEPVQPVTSAIRDAITTGNGDLYLAVKGLLNSLLRLSPGRPENLLGIAAALQ
ncbi:MAG: hypothetical protein BZY87_07235 [SAR202 cluster bacterium Io17-Chloro-G6]|nr:MAG: hypothetical protein BZY87_07235 [SAR202 cluster bacterium Io17-Chloro-G6]